jgi:hypothetical protein
MITDNPLTLIFTELLTLGVAIATLMIAYEAWDDEWWKGIACAFFPPYAIYYMLVELNHKHKKVFVWAYFGLIALLIVLAIVAEFVTF